jgi:hypothetical protein
MLYILILTHIVFLIAGFFLAKYYFLKDSFLKGKAEGEFEKEKSLFYNNINDKESLTSDLISNKLQLEHIRGKEIGIKEQKDKLTIVVTPKMEIIDGFFKKTAITSYVTQVNYEGFPIGGPQTNIVEKLEKFKDENMKYAIDKLNETVITVANLLIEKHSINTPIPKLFKKENVKISK